MNSTDVCNFALTKIGERVINSIDDPNDKNARHAKLHYGAVLKEVLREGFWSFALVSRALEAEESDDFLSAELAGWSYAFALPADFVKLEKLTGVCGKIDKFRLQRAAGKACLLANEETVTLHYVWSAVLPDDFEPFFLQAVVTLLAARLARAISGSEELETTLVQRYEAIDLPKARAAMGQDSESNENHPLDEIIAGSLTSRGYHFGPPVIAEPEE